MTWTCHDCDRTDPHIHVMCEAAANGTRESRENSRPLTPDEVFTPPAESAIRDAVARLNALLVDRARSTANGDSPEVAVSEICDDRRVRAEVIRRFEAAGWYVYSWTGVTDGPLKFGRRTVEDGPPPAALSTRPGAPQPSPPPPPYRGRCGHE